MKKCYRALIRLENFLGNFLLLAIRLYWGGLLVLTGLEKWTQFSSTTDFFASLDIPAPAFSALLAGLIEVVGGASLFVGLFSRLTSLILVAFFLVAYATAHNDALINFFVTPTLFFEQAPFLYLYASAIVFCFGPGFLSFDYWIEKNAFKKKS